MSPYDSSVCQLSSPPSFLGTQQSCASYSVYTPFKGVNLAIQVFFDFSNNNEINITLKHVRYFKEIRSILQKKRYQDLS